MTHSEHANTGHSNSGGSGGGFFAKLRGQAEAALQKVPAYDEFQHVMRQTSVAANPRQSPHTAKLQLAVKGAKGVIIDHDAVARESKSYSKNILDLVRLENRAAGTDAADIQDVGDRLAFLTYKQGELHTEYAKKLEEARTALKDIRNYETSLSGQRDRRAQLENQISRLRTQSKPDTHTPDRIADIDEELKALAGPGTPLSEAEAKVNNLKREKLKQSFEIQFDALQELGEKLSVLAGYGKELLSGWDTNETTAGKHDYVDGARTAAVRTGVENALNGWNRNKAYVPRPTIKVGGAGSAPSVAPSFHDSHGAELASLPAETDPVAAHNQAFDSYYSNPDSPGLPGGSASSGQAAPPTRQSAPSVHSVSSTGTSHMPIPGSFNDSSDYNTPSGANPFAEQINTAPVTQLPPATMTSQPSPPSAIGVQANSNPFADHSQTGYGAAPVGAHSSSLASPSAMPTVAETGAPIIGTGGPSSGVLPPPAHPSRPQGSSSGSIGDVLAGRQHNTGESNGAQRKEDEVRQEINERFNQYSTSNAGAVDLDRDTSLRGRRDGEQLPAYNVEGGAENRPTPPEKH